MIFDTLYYHDPENSKKVAIELKKVRFFYINSTLTDYLLKIN